MVPAKAPEAQGGGTLVVPTTIKSCHKEVVGKFSCLFETIYTFLILEVYPSVSCKGGEVEFSDEFLWDD